MLDALAYYVPRFTLLGAIGWVLAPTSLAALERLAPLFAN